MIFIRISSRSVLLGKVVLARLPEIFVDLFQGEIFQSIEPAKLHQHGMVCRIVLEVVLFEFEEFVHSLEVHEHFFDKAIIDRIVIREMMAAILCGKRIKVNGFLAVYLNEGNIVHKSKVSA